MFCADTPSGSFCIFKWRRSRSNDSHIILMSMLSSRTAIEINKILFCLFTLLSSFARSSFVKAFFSSGAAMDVVDAGSTAWVFSYSFPPDLLNVSTRSLYIAMFFSKFSFISDSALSLRMLLKAGFSTN